MANRASMSDRERLIHAIDFACRAHGAQVRKHTGQPYLTHCLQVARLVETACPHAPAYMLQAAILHDVVEDTKIGIDEIAGEFGSHVADIVLTLTDPPKEAGNRAYRKQIVRDKLRGGSSEAKTIKCADILDNMPSIEEYDPDFFKVFVEEAALLIPILEDGAQPILWRMLKNFIAGAQERIAKAAA